MVLGRRQQHQPLAVGEGKHRNLRPLQPFFQHQGGPRRAETPREDLLDGRSGFLQAGRHGHALTRSETIGLDHQGAALGLKHRQGLLAIAATPVAGRGDAGFGHQLLGPSLTGLQQSAVGSGTKNRQPRLPQPIGQTGRQGGLRAHHHQVDLVAEGGLLEGVPIAFSNRQRLAARNAGGPPIARSHPHPLHSGTAGQGPAEGIFTAAGAHHQNPPGTAAWGMGVRCNRRQHGGAGRAEGGR